MLQAIFLSCGFDGVEGDPSEAGTRLTERFFGSVASRAAAVAPVVATLQGGYLPEAVAACGRAVIEGLRNPGRPAEILVEDGDTAAAAKVARRLHAAEPGEWWEVGRSFEHGCG